MGDQRYVEAAVGQFLAEGFTSAVRWCPWPDCSPRFWPPKVPTPQDEFVFSASLGFPPLARLFHAEGLAFGNDEDVVMKQPVEQADGR
jgi:hypothetical protein